MMFLRMIGEDEPELRYPSCVAVNLYRDEVFVNIEECIMVFTSNFAVASVS